MGVHRRVGDDPNGRHDATLTEGSPYGSSTLYEKSFRTKDRAKMAGEAALNRYRRGGKLPKPENY